VTPGAEQAGDLPMLVWAGDTRLESVGGGRWAPTEAARMPAPLAAGQVAGGPRGYLAVGAIDPGSGAYRAWTWDGEGPWKAVAGSDEGLSRREDVTIVSIVGDEAGWLIVTRTGARYAGWRVRG
jgi:hypothetical protein